MSGSIPVFVHADEPAVQVALVDALVRQSGISVVDFPDAARWIVLTGSESDDGADPTGPRMVAFVTSMAGSVPASGRPTAGWTTPGC